MDITRRCDYACRILRAAYKSGDTFVSVTKIAEDENIPYAFARSIQHDLVVGGLVKTERGARGGLTLNCDPTQVTLLEVLESVQGPVSVSLCAIDPDFCDKHDDCAYNKLWRGADQLLRNYFNSITLKDLFEQGATHPTIESALLTPSAPQRGTCALTCSVHATSKAVSEFPSSSCESCA
ncbi:Rrf2 family transcriptional regulator [Eggerthella sp. YY7918]|uniref:RrF2 family transcriptional regulator n=1 Tax=Eggerthella sp. (strain YY7918) TaxID=502558 RepID=UPI000217156B|nr:Rrf2 family transcriptional regulator [Eggerthella sp. YY7918]BAK44393.1 predicted transcriptional regulator [Eggerthella sp. YY7918]